MIAKMKKYQFLFQQLVHRDFTHKYKRTVLGVAWSVLSPLMSLFVMNMIFKTILGSTIEHYTIYLFSGQLIFSFFTESTNEGMGALVSNADIFSKVNVPKYMFLLSKNASSMINFVFSAAVYFLFVALEGLPFTWKFICLLYPVVCQLVFNLGMGLILSALYLFFRDTQYLYNIFTTLLMYVSAIFYEISIYPEFGQKLFMLNPMYVNITYFRQVVIEGVIPNMTFHLISAGYAILAFTIGCIIYKKKNETFLYYV